VSNEVETPKTFMVPAQDAALLRPILDERKKGAQQEGVRGGNLLYGLTQKKGRAADEALVVLMCFYMGDSREETDAVIAPRQENAAASEEISRQESQDS
jgi:hypothetical protein